MPEAPELAQAMAAYADGQELRGYVQEALAEVLDAERDFTDGDVQAPRICAELLAHIDRLTAKPNLGLATTRELLAEISARIEIDYYAGGGGLDYSTVKGRPNAALEVGQ